LAGSWDGAEDVSVFGAEEAGRDDAAGEEDAGAEGPELAAGSDARTDGRDAEDAEDAPPDDAAPFPLEQAAVTVRKKAARRAANSFLAIFQTLFSCFFSL
jgi:hypothetical protein